LLTTPRWRSRSKKLPSSTNDGSCDGRLDSQPAEDAVHDQLLLALLKTTQPPDDLGHPSTEVAAREYTSPFAHHLQPDTALVDNQPGSSDFRDCVGVAAGKPSVPRDALSLG
jgi:hypothetical protein